MLWSDRPTAVQPSRQWGQLHQAFSPSPQRPWLERKQAVQGNPYCDHIQIRALAWTAESCSKYSPLGRQRPRDPQCPVVSACSALCLEPLGAAAGALWA